MQMVNDSFKSMLIELQQVLDCQQLGVRSKATLCKLQAQGEVGRPEIQENHHPSLLQCNAPSVAHKRFWLSYIAVFEQPWSLS
jgi:hypothetical protein